MTVVLTALIVAAVFALAAGAEYLYLAWWGYADRCTRCLGRGTEHNSSRPCIVCAGDGRREP